MDKQNEAVTCPGCGQSVRGVGPRFFQDSRNRRWHTECAERSLGGSPANVQKMVDVPDPQPTQPGPCVTNPRTVREPWPQG